MKYLQNRGFTLIELLVVIAIIGVLAGVVLAALGNVRKKGDIASIQSNLYNAHSQAEMFYATNGTYVGVCGGVAVGGEDPINKFVDAASEVTSSSNVYTGTAAQNSAGRRAICRSTASAWVISAPIDSSVSSWLCADSTGVTEAQSTAIAGNTYACP